MGCHLPLWYCVYPFNFYSVPTNSPYFLVLNFDDIINSESRAICRYVCEKYIDKGNRGLYGTNTLAKASIDQWLEAEGQSFNPSTSTLVFQLAFASRMKIKQDQGLIKQSEGKLAKVLMEESA
ncbi:glutathione S-transferase-like [Quillaja saponaria]|nr:glutathione S-transferase-like [Quillaja saponaria]